LQLLITVEVTGTRKIVIKKKVHTRERRRGIRENGKKQKGSVGAVQEEGTFSLHGPNTDLFYVMAIQKVGLSVILKFVVGVWDGLDECSISQPEIVSQSGPAVY